MTGPGPEDLPEGLQGLTPDEVLAFLREASDEALRERVHDIGTDVVLRLVFEAWAARVRPAERRSPGLLVFVLDDDGATLRHGLRLDARGAAAAVEPADDPRATVSTTLVRFLRVAAGAQDPKRLVLTGRMRLGGDVLWSVSTLAGLSQG